jgi:heavy metal efflux system protein
MGWDTSDTFIILKSREEWPDPELTKDELQRQIEEAVGALAGNAYEFSQPIQWRFNELIAGVRGDIAIKVFGEEFDPMLRVANQIASILRGVKGAEDVKVEQVTGLPFLDIKIDKAEIARLGLSVSAVQDVIGGRATQESDLFQRASRKQRAIILSERTNVLTGRILDMILLEAVW